MFPSTSVGAVFRKPSAPSSPSIPRVTPRRASATSCATSSAVSRPPPSYRREASRIEMHLIATAPQRVRLRRLGLVVELAEAEGIWTESSYKFTRESTETMLAEAGLAIDAWYTDAEGRFGLVLARPLSPDAAR